MTTETGSSERGAGLPTLRSSPSASRILVAVVVSALVIIGLTAWVVFVPYRGSVSVGPSLDCDARVSWTDDAAGRSGRASFEQSCDDARSSRRTMALLIGAGVATAACAASTWPSKRLTGEALGPLR